VKSTESRAEGSLKRWRSLGALTILGRFRFLAATSARLPDDADPEVIHKARVASRRARAALDTFGDVLPKRIFRLARSDLRALLDALGPARDRDVQALRVKGLMERAPAPARPGMRRILLRLDQRRAAIQPEVVLSTVRFREAALEERLFEVLGPLLVNAPSEWEPLPAAVSHRAHEVLGKWIDRLQKGMQCALEAAGSTLEPTALHATRISAKRLRYTLELFEAGLPEAVALVLPSVKDLQAVLGELHDGDVWRELLSALCDEERVRVLEHQGSLSGFSRFLPGFAFLEAEEAEAGSRARRTWSALVADIERRELWTAFHARFRNQENLSP
jgi:CHAD domain-containing protein